MKKTTVLIFFICLSLNVWGISVKNFEDGFSPDSLYYNKNLVKYPSNAKVNFNLNESKILFVGTPYC